MALIVFSQFASASTYLQPIIDFVEQGLITALKRVGNTIAFIMFIYGAAKYVYSADDPAGRKTAMGVCIAAVVAFLFIRIADNVIYQMCVAMPACTP
ncbi:MAG: hypothetical protein GF416_08140 [Candidatus Altiarchaeales archaeon]|nr:hypothetical protein [Candidatus Altiarchaeales archaeon]